MEQQGVGQGLAGASRMIESLTGWWELAGVDSAVGAVPVDWLAMEAKADVVGPVNAQSLVAEDISRTEPARPVVDWPSDIDMLKAMMADGVALPGNAFGTAFVAPVGAAQSDVMVVSDMPDQDELAGRKLGSGASGLLLERMLAAIQVGLPDCYWTALATTIPPTGEVPENELAGLADFVRHQIGLVKPRSLILLGSAASKALLGEELMEARQSLGNINYEGRNMAVLTTFHPRTLIARPAMKAQAWKDLQMFAKRAAL